MATKTVEKVRPDVVTWWPDVFGRRFGDWFDLFDMPVMPMKDVDRMMKVEELVDGKEYVVRAEMPGIDPEKDVEVHVRNHMLELRAERKVTETKEEKGMHRSEFSYGSFYRSIALPPDATEHDVHATYKDGILEVRLPLDKKQREATKIEVNRK